VTRYNPASDGGVFYWQRDRVPMATGVTEQQALGDIHHREAESVAMIAQ
jgi:hypothetical protein